MTKLDNEKLVIISVWEERNDCFSVSLVLIYLLKKKGAYLLSIGADASICRVKLESGIDEHGACEHVQAPKHTTHEEKEALCI